MKESGRKSAKVPTSRSRISHQRQREWNQPSVAAENASDALVAANATSSTSHQLRTLISSSIGLKMNTKGSTTVRSAYTEPCTPVLIASSPEIAAAANVARPTGGV